MKARIELLWLVCSLSLPLGCGSEAAPETPSLSARSAVLDEPSIGDSSGPGTSSRPADLRWVPFSGGLELTAWAVQDEARVVFLIRNATEGPVACPDARCMAGLSSVWARPVGGGSWTRLGPVSPIPLGGVGISAKLAPGSELLTDRPLFSPFDSSVKPRPLEGTFELGPGHFRLPDRWVGEVEIRISCSLPPDPERYHTPGVQLSVESIRRQRRALSSEFEFAAPRPPSADAADAVDGIAPQNSRTPAPSPGEINRPSPPEQSDAPLSINIQALDQKGRALSGLPIALVRLTDFQGASVGAPVRYAQNTDDNGLISISWDAQRMAEVEGAIWAEVLGVFDPPVRALVRDVGGAIAPEVSLQVPAFGQVEVHVAPGPVHHPDRPGHDMISLWVQGQPDPDCSFFGLAMRFRKLMQNSSALFPIVQVGLQLQARFFRVPIVYEELGFQGPRSQDQLVRIDLPTPSPPIRGRLAGPTGAPLTGVCGFVREAKRRGRTSEPFLSFCTDQEGRMIWKTVSRRFEPRRHTRLLVEIDPEHGHFTPQVVECDPPFGFEALELGVLVFCEAPLLARGRVLSGEGEPILGATVRLEQRQAEGYSWRVVSVAGQDLETSSTAEGRFSIHGEPTASEYRLVASQEGYVVDELRLPRLGSTNLELRLDPAGALVGVFVLDPLIVQDTCNLEVTTATGESLAVLGLRGGPTQVEGLPVGMVQASVLAPNGTVAKKLTDIEIVAGETVDLGVVDLRETLFAYLVRVKGSGGSDPVKASAYSFDFKSTLGAMFAGSGWILVVSTTRNPRVRFRAVGYRDSEAIQLDGKTEVSLVALRRIGTNSFGFPTYADW